MEQVKGQKHESNDFGKRELLNGLLSQWIEQICRFASGSCEPFELSVLFVTPSFHRLKQRVVSLAINDDHGPFISLNELSCQCRNPQTRFSGPRSAKNVNVLSEQAVGHQDWETHLFMKPKPRTFGFVRISAVDETVGVSVELGPAFIAQTGFFAFAQFFKHPEGWPNRNHCERKQQHWSQYKDNHELNCCIDHHPCRTANESKTDQSQWKPECIYCKAERQNCRE